MDLEDQLDDLIRKGDRAEVIMAMRGTNKMQLDMLEQKICEKFSERDHIGHVHCFECPLVIDARNCTCKANINKEEWEALEKNDCQQKNRNRR